MWFIKGFRFVAIHNIPYLPNFNSTDVSTIKLAIKDSTYTFGIKDVVCRGAFLPQMLL